MLASEWDSLKPGDKIKIVSKKNNYRGWNNQGKMDCWLGKIVTVKVKGFFFLKIEEDSQEWIWDSEMIEYKIYNDSIVIY